MKKRRSFLIATLLVPFLLFGCARNSGTSAEDAGKTVGRSANWKVEIVSAKREKANTKPGQPFELTVSLKVQYLGPSSSVRAPTFNVINERGEKLAVSDRPIGFPPETGSLAGWLMVGMSDSMYGPKDPPEPQSMTPLETNKSFEFHINYMPAYVAYLDNNQRYQGRPTTLAKNFSLVFADVPPIPLVMANSQ